MKVLWLSHLIPYPPKAGVLQRCYYLIRELAKYHQVDLMAFIQRDLLMSFYSDFEAGIEESKSVLNSIVNSVEYFDIPSETGRWGKRGLALKGLFDLNGYTMDWLKSKPFLERLTNKLDQQQYDLVHFDTISLAVYRRFAGSIPTSLDHHNIESHMMLRRSRKEKNILKKIYYFQEGLKIAGAEKKYCRDFDVNITCSDMDVERLRKVVGDVNCVSVPNGVDVDYFKPVDTPRRKASLIFIGTMNWYPNVEAVEFILSKIWPQLRQSHPEVTLDIVGAAAPESIMRHNGTNGVTVHGFVDDIRTLFDSAHIYICPITDGGGTKLKILDAMAMGKAIVAHPIACEGINLIHMESVMFCEKPADFINALDLLLNDDGLVQKLGAKARKIVVDEYAFVNIGERLSYTLSALQ